jgi:tetratricopeptide (TPR) repeat protein
VLSSYTERVHAAPDTRTAAPLEGLLALALSRPGDALARAAELLSNGPPAAVASIAHQARGIVLRDAGQTVEAIGELRTALRLARESTDAQRAVDVQATLGVTLGFAGRTAAGLAALDDALRGARGVLAGRVLLRRGSLLREIGRYDEALADLRRAVTLLRRGGDAVWEARARSHRFSIFAMLGQAARADRDLAVAASLYAAAGQELESAMAMHNRGLVAFQAGDLPMALRILDDVSARYVALAAVVPDLPVDRCAVLHAAGLDAEAFAEMREAVGRLDSAGPYATKKGELLLAAARAAQSVGESGRAAEWAARARDLFRRQGREWWRARAHFILLQSRYDAGDRSGRLRAELGRHADRLDRLGAEEAAAAHLLAGRLAARQGRVGEADRHLDRAARSRHRGPSFGHAAGWLAHALRAQARGAQAASLVACRRGLEAAAAHQRTLGATELRAHAAVYGTELAAIAQRDAVRRGDARMLLLWSERWRAGALAVPAARAGADDLADDAELANDLAALRDVVRRLDAARVDGAPTVRLEQDRRRLEAAIRARTRRTAGATDPASARAPLGSPRVSELVDGIGDGCLVEIIVLEDTIFVVTVVRRRVRMHRVGPVAAAIREVELARFMLRRLAYGRPARGATASLHAAGRGLQDALLGPAAADLATNRAGTGCGAPIVVPPGRLPAVPWSLLPALREAPVVVAPSATTWLRAGQVRAPRRRRVALVVGPGLPGTAAETKEIADRYPDAVVLTDGRATAEATLAALDGAWTAHVAAHGVFRADSPLFSALSLADGPLTVYDLGRLRRAPQRLILSSCESAVGAHVAADELLGMTSALVPLGTASLLASVVPVNDAATAPLMTTFHDRLRAGSSFGEALLAARAAAGQDPVAVATAGSFVALGR